MPHFLQRSVQFSVMLCTAVAHGCSGAESPDLIPVPVVAAKNVDGRGNSPLSVSPDNRWIVFFEMVPQRPEAPIPDGRNLRVIDTESGQLFAFTLESGRTAETGAHTGRSSGWTADSRLWNQLDVALAFDDRVGPRLLPNVKIQAKEGAELVIGDRTFSYADFSHCSDCYDDMYDLEIVRQVQDRARTISDQGSETILSADGTLIFYQHKPNSNKLEMTLRDIATGKDNVLTTHTGTDVVAHGLRLSPDGRFLAYHITTGYTFVRPPKLYVLDLETKKRWYVGEHVFGTMHWTSNSMRLYFAQRDDYGPLDIRYVEPPREDSSTGATPAVAGAPK